MWRQPHEHHKTGAKKDKENIVNENEGINKKNDDNKNRSCANGILKRNCTKNPNKLYEFCIKLTGAKVSLVVAGTLQWTIMFSQVCVLVSNRSRMF